MIGTTPAVHDMPAAAPIHRPRRRPRRAPQAELPVRSRHDGTRSTRQTRCGVQLARAGGAADHSRPHTETGGPHHGRSLARGAAWSRDRPRARMRRVGAHAPGAGAFAGVTPARREQSAEEDAAHVAMLTNRPQSAHGCPGCASHVRRGGHGISFAQLAHNVLPGFSARRPPQRARGLSPYS
jgi:hypothetical protein